MILDNRKGYLWTILVGVNHMFFKMHKSIVIYTIFKLVFLFFNVIFMVTINMFCI
jgi:hypothetical protein